MKTATITALIVALIGTASFSQDGETINSFTTKSGIEYKDVQVKRKTDRAIVIMHSGGMASIKYSDLPDEIAAKFDYNPDRRYFTIFAPGQETDAISALSDTLSAGNTNRVQVAATFQDALNAEADALILLLDHRFGSSVQRLAPEALAMLRTKKIIGIGLGSSSLFRALGLELKAGGQNRKDRAPEIQIQANVDYSKHRGQKITAFQLDEDVPDPEGRMTPNFGINFAMTLNRNSEAAPFVEAIARWQVHKICAPIVKQGNYILVGLAAPATAWTQEYRSFFAEMAGALGKQAPLPFSKVEFKRETTPPPGEYDFELAKSRNTTEHGRWFYFRFTKPTAFSATLEHTGSSKLFLTFWGDEGAHWTQKEARKGEGLRIEADITAEDIKRVGDEYWRLMIKNYDRSHRTTCRLKIEY
jgi:hypothetical protein